MKIAKLFLVSLFAMIAVPSFAASPASGSSKFTLPFIENNFEKAVAQAKASDRPIFVEAWAPW